MPGAEKRWCPKTGASLNRLSNVDWKQVQQYLDVQRIRQPGILERRYRMDEARREHLATQGLSTHYVL